MQVLGLFGIGVGNELSLVVAAIRGLEGYPLCGRIV